MPRIRLSKGVMVLLAVLAILQYRLWFEPGGIKDVIHLKSMLSQQEAENAKLRKRNSDLLAQVKNLKSSDDAEEARARSELGMIKKGETFYQVVRT
jgi:cell division protein FtsB